MASRGFSGVTRYPVQKDECLVASKTQEEILDKVKIPTLLESTQKILKLTQSPDASSRDYSRLITHDPGLSTKVLKLVNSAVYSLRKRVASIQDACVLLGLRNLRSLCLSSALAQEMSRGDSKALSDCWQYSLATGDVARRIANIVCPDLEGDVSTAGLLHAIGIIALLGTEELGYRDLVRNPVNQGKDWGDVEEEHLGFRHGSLGAAIARRWRIREEVCSIIEFAGQSEPPECSSVWSLRLASAAVQDRSDSFRHLNDPTGALTKLQDNFPEESEAIADHLEAMLNDAELQLELLR